MRHRLPRRRVVLATLLILVGGGVMLSQGHWSAWDDVVRADRQPTTTASLGFAGSGQGTHPAPGSIHGFSPDRGSNLRPEGPQRDGDLRSTLADEHGSLDQGRAAPLQHAMRPATEGDAYPRSGEHDTYIPRQIMGVPSGVVIPAVRDPTAAFRLEPGDNGGVTRFDVDPQAPACVIVILPEDASGLLVDGRPAIPGMAYPVSQGMTLQALRPVGVNIRRQDAVAGPPAGPG